MPTHELLTISEFIKWSRLGRTRVYEEIGAGDLRALKIGRRTFVRRDDALAWLDSKPVLVTKGDQ